MLPLYDKNPENFFCGSCLTQPDDGVSGTKFERKGFQDMLRDVERGLIERIELFEDRQVNITLRFSADMFQEVLAL